MKQGHHACPDCGGEHPNFMRDCPDKPVDTGHLKGVPVFRTDRYLPEGVHPWGDKLQTWTRHGDTLRRRFR